MSSSKRHHHLVCLSWCQNIHQCTKRRPLTDCRVCCTYNIFRISFRDSSPLTSSKLLQPTHLGLIKEHDGPLVWIRGDPKDEVCDEEPFGSPPPDTNAHVRYFPTSSFLIRPLTAPLSCYLLKETSSLAVSFIFGFILFRFLLQNGSTRLETDYGI